MTCCLAIALDTNNRKYLGQVLSWLLRGVDFDIDYRWADDGRFNIAVEVVEPKRLN
jgi:hypothetical protein